jgi:hypothetical protein
MIESIFRHLLHGSCTKFRLRPTGTTDIEGSKTRVQKASLYVLCHASNIRMIYISSRFRKKNRNARHASGIGFLFRNSLSPFRSEYSQNVTLVRFHPPVRQGQIAGAFRHQISSTLMGLAKKVHDHKLFWFPSCMVCVTLTYMSIT